MWTRSGATLTVAMLLLISVVADAAPADPPSPREDRLCDFAIARAETRRNTIRTEVRRSQQSDSFEAEGLRIVDGLLKNAGRFRDRRDWRSCIWYAEEAYNFGRPGRPEPPLQTN
jgi:hypothetical protein